MPAVVIVGSQYGDEGKGKIVDWISEEGDVVVRYQGGNNAGHTVVVEGKEYKFHSLPVGALRGKRCLIGCGVVLDPRQLAKELSSLGHEADLGIDPRTPIIMPYHNIIDIARESKTKNVTGAAIGTTAKGIGPCYEDEKSRVGLRFFDLISDPARLEKLIDVQFKEKETILKNVYGKEIGLAVSEIVKEYKELGEMLKKYMGNVSVEVQLALSANANVIFEGAQGTMLDIKYGNYPKVTSSHPLTGSIFTGVGLPLNIVKKHRFRTIGIVKAYTTKVGSGPVVTCLDNQKWPVEEAFSEPEAIYIRKKGKEVGATTGRPRRVGWLDLVLLKYSTCLNGFDEFALTKIDTLAGLERIKVAVAYEHSGKKITEYPAWDLRFLSECKPIYKELPGFGEFNADKYSKLPKEVKAYARAIEVYTGVPVSMISTGPERSAIVLKKGYKKF